MAATIEEVQSAQGTQEASSASSPAPAPAVKPEVSAPTAPIKTELQKALAIAKPIMERTEGIAKRLAELLAEAEKELQESLKAKAHLDAAIAQAQTKPKLLHELLEVGKLAMGCHATGGEAAFNLDRAGQSLKVCISAGNNANKRLAHIIHHLPEEQADLDSTKLDPSFKQPVVFSSLGAKGADSKEAQAPKAAVADTPRSSCVVC